MLLCDYTMCFNVLFLDLLVQCASSDKNYVYALSRFFIGHS